MVGDTVGGLEGLVVGVFEGDNDGNDEDPGFFIVGLRYVQCMLGYRIFIAINAYQGGAGTYQSDRCGRSHCSALA